MVYSDSYIHFFNLLAFCFLILLIQSDSVLLSVLLLILIACCFSLYIISLSSLFVGLIYLAVYVGAVTVFILFVVMMTDLSAFSITEKNNKTFPFIVYTAVFVSVAVSCTFIYVTESALFLITGSINFSTIQFFNLISNFAIFSQTSALAFELLQNNLAPFFVLGFIILMTLVGSIFVIIQNNAALSNNCYKIVDKEAIKILHALDYQLVNESRDVVKLNYLRK